MYSVTLQCVTRRENMVCTESRRPDVRYICKDKMIQIKTEAMNPEKDL